MSLFVIYNLVATVKIASFMANEESNAVLVDEV